jgi:osmotically-inducible protein OsmY
MNIVILAVFMVIASGCASTDKQQATGEYIDDSVITAKIKTALIKDDNAKAREINVVTFKGVCN